MELDEDKPQDYDECDGFGSVECDGDHNCAAD